MTNTTRNGCTGVEQLAAAKSRPYCLSPQAILNDA